MLTTVDGLGVNDLIATVSLGEGQKKSALILL